MKVNILNGQTDISKPDLGHLQNALDKALVDFFEADNAFGQAVKVRDDAIRALHVTQNKLSAAFELLRKEAPPGTPWSLTEPEPPRQEKDCTS